MKKSILTLAILATILSCKKQKTTITETPENTNNTTVKKTKKTFESDETKAKSEPKKDDVETETDEQITVNEAESNGRKLKVTYRFDAEGSPVVVLSENGKDLWLYQTESWAKGGVYEDQEKGIKLTSEADNITLNEKGKITKFLVK